MTTKSRTRQYVPKLVINGGLQREATHEVEPSNGSFVRTDDVWPPQMMRSESITVSGRGDAVFAFTTKVRIGEGFSMRAVVFGCGLVIGGPRWKSSHGGGCGGWAVFGGAISRLAS